jgi:hypothetical protein
VFDTLLEAKVLIERWRKVYNTARLSGWRACFPSSGPLRWRPVLEMLCHE